jgi:glucose-1-phosphate thymidylyltransferase
VIGSGTRLVDAYIGPFTSIADGCLIERTELDHSVVLAGCTVRDIGRIVDSLLGREVEIGRSDRKPSAYRLMLGDHSQVSI